MWRVFLLDLNSLSPYLPSVTMPCPPTHPVWKSSQDPLPSLALMPAWALSLLFTRCRTHCTQAGGLWAWQAGCLLWEMSSSGGRTWAL